jgi:hypothetical protein
MTSFASGSCSGSIAGKSSLGTVAIGVVEDEKWICFDGLDMRQVLVAEDVDQSCLGVVEGQTLEEFFDAMNSAVMSRTQTHTFFCFHCDFSFLFFSERSLYLCFPKSPSEWL